MLNTANDVGERPAQAEASRVAAHADTILFPGCEDLEAAYRYLVAQGGEGGVTEGRTVRDEAVVRDGPRRLRCMFPVAG